MKWQAFPMAFAVLVVSFPLAQAGLVSSGIPAQDFASLTHPVSVTWVGNGFVVSYRDGTTRLATIGLDGQVQQFAPSFQGKQEVYVALSNGRAGFSPRLLFLCSGDTVYQMDQSGGPAKLFSSPSPGSTVEYIAFDTDGAWNYLLYALTANGGLWAINSTGSATLITNFGANLIPEGLTVAPSTFGAYAGYMFISRESSHDLIALPKNDPRSSVSVATFPGEAPERVMVVPSRSDLYVAKYDQGAIVKIDASNFAGYAGSLLVITEGEAGQKGSMTILRPTGSSINATRIFEDTSSPHFEGAAFAPVASTSTASTTTGAPGSPQTQLLVVAGAALVVLIVGLAVALRRSGAIGVASEGWARGRQPRQENRTK